MRRAVGLALFLAGLGAGPAHAASECRAEEGGGSYCLYRSFAPSTGIVASCRSDRDCRVGYYYGDPAAAVWFEPAGMATLPKPEVTWLTGTLAQVRFDCGEFCSMSYFFDVRTRRVSEPRNNVLATDFRRLLVAEAEQQDLVVRQMFSGREVARIRREWAPGESLGQAIARINFDPDGRLSLTWLRGPERSPVSERLSVPSVPR